MTRLKLEIADSAWERLDHLAHYWVQHNSMDRIEAMVDELLDQAEWLRSHPRAGAIEIHKEHTRYRYRRWVVRSVKIVYRITRTAIRVTDFFDARQDPNKMRG
jgi:toxin ParE1/3/4